MSSEASMIDELNLEQVDWPSVSVIIVTKGHYDLAQNAVDSVLATEYPFDRRQIVVVEETDKPKPIEGRGVEYHTIPERNLGVAFARNQGVKYAQHKIIAFTDDDCLVEKRWLKEIVKPLLKSDDVAAVAGSVLLPDCGPIGQCENILGFPGGGVKFIHAAQGKAMSLPTFSTCNCAINKELVSRIYFQEGFQAAGEDELLSRTISAYHKIIFNPNAAVRHKPRDKFSEVFYWFIRRGQARVEMLEHVQKKSSYLLNITSTSPIFRLALVISLSVVLNLNVSFILVSLGILYFLSVNWRFRWAWKYYPSLKVFLHLPIVKSIMDLGMDIGVLRTVVRKKRKFA